MRIDAKKIGIVTEIEKEEGKKQQNRNKNTWDSKKKRE